MSERRICALLAALAVAGFVISAYLTWSHLRGGGPVCVGGSSGCETVQTSRYSEILGIPVAALGLLAYAGLLCSAAVKGERAALFGLLIALTGTLYSAYPTWLVGTWRFSIMQLPTSFYVAPSRIRGNV